MIAGAKSVERITASHSSAIGAASGASNFAPSSHNFEDVEG